MGSKSSRHNATPSEPLNRETINELCQDTGFTEEELLEWHRTFYNDCPDGKLTLRQFEHQYAKIMGKPTPRTADYIRHMFNVYDEDRNQFIDFREFVMALSAASAVNRLRLIETLFHVFDLDNDGKITKEEIGKMLQTLVDVTKSNNKNQSNSNQRERTKQISIQQRIDDAFNELNANDDDHITKDEFINWYLKSGLISDVQSEEINVSGSSEIQKIGKKSRKQIKRLILTKSNSDQEENRTQGLQYVPHMTRMTERRVPSKHDDDDDNDDDDNNNNYDHADKHLNKPTTVLSKRQSHDSHHDVEPKVNRKVVRIVTSNDELAENERWQHLFNSVLGQIHAQRAKDQQVTTNETNNLSSWEREGEERSTTEYMRQKVNGRENYQNAPITNTHLQLQRNPLHRRSPSPDIITVRL